MSDKATAYIRTYAPFVAAWIITLAAQYGLDLSSGQDALTGFLVVLGGAIYYAVARLIGTKYPKVETLMLGSSKTPTYK